MDIRLLLLAFLFALTSAIESGTKGNATIDIQSDPPTKILSRRKRFLVFPDGSSFQLVFCTQNHGYLQIGNIVWFGNTAALAWELPTDPEIFSMFKEHKKVYGNRRQDSNKHIYYLDEDGKVIGKVPYKRRPIVNPAFAKRSINGDTPEVNEIANKISPKELHEKENRTNHLKHLEPSRVDFHRSSRMHLYGKLEKVLDGLGWNGRECVLRLLCQTGKGRSHQGTFLQEIVRATFTLPQGRQFDSESYKEYDVAHGSNADCEQMYPDCENLSVM